MNDDIQIKMCIHTKHLKNIQQYICHPLFILRLRKIKFDSLSFNMLERLGFIINPP